MLFTIITAGGTGSRMNSEIPKQFLELQGVPVLMHSIKRFFTFYNDIKIILTLPYSHISYWQNLCRKHKFLIPHQIVNGGINRFESVKSGLELISEEGFVAIHDGVRPMVDIYTISECFRVAKEQGNAVPVLEIIDSIRMIDNDGNKIVNREKFRRVCTPEVFDCKLIKTAFNQEYNELFTDCSSVAESIGVKINLVTSNQENIKITKPLDLKFAELILNENPNLRYT